MLATATNPSLRDKPARTLDELQDLLSDAGRDHHDHVVEADDLHVDGETGILRVFSKRREYAFRPLALSQIAAKLRIPGNYLQRCPNELRADNINHWLGKQRNSRMLLRCSGDEARAVLSGRYAVVNHTDMVSWLREAFGDDASLRFELTEGYLDIQFVRSRDYQARPGDLLNEGIAVRNSEVGLACVELRGLIYRQICLNGLILAGAQHTWKRRHIGDMTLANRVREEVIRLGASLPSAIEGFSTLHNVRAPDMQGLFKRVIETYELSEPQSNAISEAFLMEPGDTLYHAVNAVTRAGNSGQLSLDSRRRLQEVGGGMLERSRQGRSWLN